MISEILVKGKFYTITTKKKEQIRGVYVEKIGNVLVFAAPDAATYNLSTEIIKTIKLN